MVGHTLLGWIVENERLDLLRLVFSHWNSEENSILMAYDAHEFLSLAVHSESTDIARELIAQGAVSMRLLTLVSHC